MRARRVWRNNDTDHRQWQVNWKVGSGQAANTSPEDRTHLILSGQYGARQREAATCALHSGR